MSIHGTSFPLLRAARPAVGLILVLHTTLSSCQSTAVKKYELAHPLSIGLKLPQVTPPGAGPLYSAIEWQRQIANDLEQSHVGVRVVCFDSKDTDPWRPKDCDIVIQPVVQIRELGRVSNNSGAIAANIAWLTTYLGYFLFSDMSVDDPSKLTFHVYGYNGIPTLAENKTVKSPELNLSFGERDRVFSSRFFLGLILFPALHPAVCRMVGLDAADPKEVASEVQGRLSSAFAVTIAEFVDGQLAAQQDAKSLPYLLGTGMRMVKKETGFQLTVAVHNPPGMLPSAIVLMRDAGGAEKRVRGQVIEDSNASSTAQTRQYEFTLASIPPDGGAARLILEDDESGRRVVYTIPQQRMRQMVDSPATESKK